MGHIRDLPRKKLGVDVEKGFRPRYVTAPGKQKTVKRLKEVATDVDAVYLATDLDREGEAIAWHVLQVLRLSQEVPVHRITFHEITRRAVEAAFERGGRLNMALVEAQQTRRILDRLVGYSISPLLWKRIRGAKGLSAGRVQTAALRLVVDREREIEAFVPVEYWSIEALLAQQIPDPTPFIAKLWKIDGQDPDLKNRDDAEAIVQALQGAIYWVEKVEQKRQQRRPWPPFTTSTLQQAAAKALGFPPKLTMKIAQQLYEGVSLGEEGNVGLITYMRTDSTYVAPEAQAAAREVIAHYWGEDYVPAQPPTYKTKVKSAQEAHEAIRPTDPARTPRQVRPFLDDKQDRLYTLIWRRFIASQMKPAVYDVTTALIPTAAETRENRLPYLFRARGRVLLFDGFLKVYEEHKDVGEEEEKEEALPPLTAGEGLDLLELIPRQHWTKPPPRYTEASLVKELERRGIGRPSTFAAMVALIRDRGYVRREKKVLVPTPLGFIVCDVLVAAFPDLFDYGFTARMEDGLDDIANGQAERLATLEGFWSNLSGALERAKEEMPTVRLEREKPQPTGENCPECGGELLRRKGKYGYFVGCANFPRCKYIQPRQPETTGLKCPPCGGDLVVRRGRYGPFVGCASYPACKYIDKTASQNRGKGDVVK
ncbi:MAG: type I DNA topoisomerase [Anaerolineae bacterium]|nr:MAG: type I DNA topoisomerase [Anaerolineae bacterium]